jgi:hypothetical protein
MRLLVVGRRCGWRREKAVESGKGRADDAAPNHAVTTGRALALHATGYHFRT